MSKTLFSTSAKLNYVFTMCCKENNSFFDNYHILLGRLISRQIETQFNSIVGKVPTTADIINSCVAVFKNVYNVELTLNPALITEEDILNAVQQGLQYNSEIIESIEPNIEYVVFNISLRDSNFKIKFAFNLNPTN